jgi:hypothetical protein
MITFKVKEEPEEKVKAAGVVAASAQTPLPFDLNTMFNMLFQFMFFMLFFRLFNQMIESMTKAVGASVSL